MFKLLHYKKAYIRIYPTALKETQLYTMTYIQICQRLFLNVYFLFKNLNKTVNLSTKTSFHCLQKWYIDYRRKLNSMKSERDLYVFIRTLIKETPYVYSSVILFHETLNSSKSMFTLSISLRHWKDTNTTANYLF